MVARWLSNSSGLSLHSILYSTPRSHTALPSASPSRQWQCRSPHSALPVAARTASRRSLPSATPLTGTRQRHMQVMMQAMHTGTHSPRTHPHDTRPRAGRESGESRHTRIKIRIDRNPKRKPPATPRRADPTCDDAQPSSGHSGPRRPASSRVRARPRGRIPPDPCARMPRPPTPTRRSQLRLPLVYSRRLPGSLHAALSVSPPARPRTPSPRDARAPPSRVALAHTHARTHTHEAARRSRTGRAVDARRGLAIGRAPGARGSGVAP